MGDYSTEHCNVTAQGEASLRAAGEREATVVIPTAPASTGAIVRRQWDVLVELANTNAQRLQAMINRVHREGGGTVYFPPGRYFIGRNVGATAGPTGTIGGVTSDDRAAIDWTKTTDVPDVLVYADVTLRFASGAVLVPMNFSLADAAQRRTIEGCSAEDVLVRIEIQGDVIADLREIFSTNLRPRVDGGASPENYLQAGKVLFTGNRVREVYPEWWGVESDLEGHWPLRNTRAFRAAIDAAHTDRRRPQRTPGGNLVRGAGGGVVWAQQTTLPIVAVGKYALAEGLQVGKTDAVVAAEEPALRVANPAPFVLRGEREAGPNAFRTFYVAADFDEPMLDLREVSFVLDKVCFEGTKRARALVRVSTGDGGVGTFEGCTFEEMAPVDDAVAVRVESPRPASGASPDDAPRPVQVAFTRCRFTCISPSFVFPEQENVAREDRFYPRRTSALVIDVGEHVGVELRNCFLIGIADPLLRAFRGHFALNETNFHASRGVHPPLPTGSNPDEVERFLNSSDGTDLYIDVPPDGAPSASFTGREVESQSFQFLATWSRTGATSPPSPAPAAACVLLNVHHTGTWNGGGVDPDPFDVNYMRPSIYWQGPAQEGACLVAIGCKFRWEYHAESAPDSQRARWARRTGGRMGAIQVAPEATAPVYHLGNTLAAAYASHDVTSLATLAPARIISTTGPALQVRALPIGNLNRSGA